LFNLRQSHSSQLNLFVGRALPVELYLKHAYRSLVVLP